MSPSGGKRKKEKHRTRLRFKLVATSTMLTVDYPFAEKATHF
jgi:hypothetical protein